MPKVPRKVGRNKKKGEITPRKRKFCEFFIELDNGTQAAIKAGYSEKTAGAAASRLLKDVKILQFLEERRKEIAQKADIRAQDVINELAKIAFANSEDFFEWDEQIVTTSRGEEKIVAKVLIKDPEKIDRDKKAAIAGIKETASGGLEFKFHDKIKALENLAKYFGAFNDAEIDKARQVKGAEKQPIIDPCETLSEDELDKQIQELEE